ncbi:hypothetical protein GCM10027579_03560 [Calidifontibacter terrae]
MHRISAEPRPAHSSTHHYGALFQALPSDHNGAVGGYVVSRQPSSALLIAKQEGSSLRSLGVRQTFNGGWQAEDGPNSVLAVVAPPDADATFVFGAGTSPRVGSTVPPGPLPVVLPDGSTAVLTQTIRSTGATPTVVGYRRADGSYVGYGGGVSGVRFAGTEVVVSPKTQQVWSGTADRSVATSSPYEVSGLPATGATIDCIIGEVAGSSPTPGCTAILIPADQTGRITTLATGVQTQEMAIPSTSWKVAFGVRVAGSTGKPLIAYG